MTTQLTRYLGIALLISSCGGGGGDDGKIANIRPGIEVLLQDSVYLLEGQRVGILTNQSGIDSRGVGDIDLLLAAGVDLQAIFSPEHGFRGTLNLEHIDHLVDSATGLPIFSLYGETRSPTAEMLELVDLLLVDLQDIGARPYTYISTAILAMRAAALSGVRVIVADRPNPISGITQGPRLDPRYSSFVGMLDLPQRHGMSFGEMAQYANATLDINVDLVVVPVANLTRAMWFDQLGLPWVRPSPNMPDLESATHYPGLVLFEATNLSVGRGTDVAFQVLGAPWFDPRRIREAIGPVPGVDLSDTTFVPIAPSDLKYPDETVAGIRFKVVDRSAYHQVELAVRILWAVADIHPELEVRGAALDSRYGNDAMRLLLENHADPEEEIESWQELLADFASEVAPYLIYPE